MSNSSGAALLAALGWAIATGLVDPPGRGKTGIAWAFPRPQDFMKKLASKGQESWEYPVEYPCATHLVSVGQQRAAGAIINEPLEVTLRATQGLPSFNAESL